MGGDRGGKEEVAVGPALAGVGAWGEPDPDSRSVGGDDGALAEHGLVELPAEDDSVVVGIDLEVEGDQGSGPVPTTGAGDRLVHGIGALRWRLGAKPRHDVAATPVDESEVVFGR